MDEWKRICFLLCVYGFFYTVNPSTDFLFQYLNEFRGVPADRVSDSFLAHLSYWSVGFSLPALLFTDMLRYKPVILVCILAWIVSLVILRWLTGNAILIASAALWSLSNATNIAYFTYIYAKVEREHYQKVTSYTRAILLVGRFCGGILSQTLIMNDLMRPDELFYISLANAGVAIVIALFLPAATTSIYFYQKRASESKAIKQSSGNSEKEEELVEFSWANAKDLLQSHLKSASENKTVVLWSIWWILLATGFKMTYNYNQVLWAFIEPDREDIYNGFAESAQNLFGALGALIAARLNQDKTERWALWILSGCSVMLGLCSIGSASTSSVIVSYVLYILIGTIYNFMITVTSAIVAKHLVQDSFALIFGINGWLASVIVVLFTVIVISGTVFTLDVAQQYCVFGYYFLVVAIAFGLYGIFQWRSSNKLQIS